GGEVDQRPLRRRELQPPPDAQRQEVGLQQRLPQPGSGRRPEHAPRRGERHARRRVRPVRRQRHRREYLARPVHPPRRRGPRQLLTATPTPRPPRPPQHRPTHGPPPPPPRPPPPAGRGVRPRHLGADEHAHPPHRGRGPRRPDARQPRQRPP